MNDKKFVSNIDTICILLDIENYEESGKSILDILEQEKEFTKCLLTEDANYKHYIELGSMTFELLPTGTKGYSYILQNSAYKIYIAKARSKIKNFAPIQIRISSEYLWSYGLDTSWGYIYNVIIENFGNVIKEKVCRLDLCTHVSSIDFITDYEKSYKGDFKKSQVFKTNNKINAITFGSRQNKNIYCRIYNKSLEIQEKKHKSWFIDIWQKHNLDIENVWNIEFEIKSKLLKRFNLETVKDVMKHLRDLWEFCTKEWLVKINRTNTRVERCNTNEQWLELQNTFNYLPYAGLIERDKQISTDADILIPSIAGFVTSYSARKNILDLDTALRKISFEMEFYFTKKKTDFFKEINKKNKQIRE